MTTKDPDKRTRARLKRLGRLQAARTDFLIDKSGHAVSKYTALVKRNARKALNTGRQFTLAAKDERSLVDELTKVALSAYVEESKLQTKLAVRASKTIAKGEVPSLELGFFEDVFKTFAGIFDIELEHIQDNLAVFAKKKVNESVTTLKQGVNEALVDITSQRLPTRTSMKLLNDELEVMGVSANKNNYVETLVRTHGQIAANAAQWDISKKSDNIWGFTYVTVGDDRVRPAHAELDYISRPKDDNFWQIAWPPNGWNCRCQALTEYFPQPITPLPRTIDIDPEWQFNSGVLLGVAA